MVLFSGSGVRKGGRRRRQKLAALRCCHRCYFCCLTGGHGWVAGVEVKVTMIMGWWCLVVSWLLLEERERVISMTVGERENLKALVIDNGSTSIGEDKVNKKRGDTTRLEKLISHF